MSEQIREQVSAFLDGELHDSETELLLKRLTRDGELRESFGRYALIGEAMRGGSLRLMTKRFAGRINLAIDGEPIAAIGQLAQGRAPRWWRPLAGAAVAAGVAAVAVVTFHQRADAPGLLNAAPARTVLASTAVTNQVPPEAVSYTVPAASSAAMLPARLTNYMFAHSKYSSGLAQRGVLADLLIDADEQQPQVTEAAAHVAP